MIATVARAACHQGFSQNAVSSNIEYGYLTWLFCNIEALSVNMVRRRLSEAQRWRIIGMHSTGKSFKSIGRHLGYHYTVISRLVRKHGQFNAVKDFPRSGRPRITSVREDRSLIRLVRRQPFLSSPALKRQWLPNRQLSPRTLGNRLN